MVGRYNAIEGTIRVLRWYDHSYSVNNAFCMYWWLFCIIFSKSNDWNWSCDNENVILWTLLLTLFVLMDILSPKNQGFLLYGEEWSRWGSGKLILPLSWCIKLVVLIDVTLSVFGPLYLSFFNSSTLLWLLYYNAMKWLVSVPMRGVSRVFL